MLQEHGPQFHITICDTILRTIFKSKPCSDTVSF
jgi:hypothetical protein